VAEFQAGEREPKELLAIAKQHLETVDRLQYLELADADTLEPAESALHRPAALCAAAYIGSTRLVDHVLLAAGYEFSAPTRQPDEAIKSLQGSSQAQDLSASSPLIAKMHTIS
jgi:Pantoate-beta-alanine ligase